MPALALLVDANSGRIKLPIGVQAVIVLMQAVC
jgi:hypothetical protein